jgi:hypothetical protein
MESGYIDFGKVTCGSGRACGGFLGCSCYPKQNPRPSYPEPWQLPQRVPPCIYPPVYLPGAPDPWRRNQVWY